MARQQNPRPEQNSLSRSMKWEEEKAQLQYDVELKTLKSLVGKILELNKILGLVNASRNQYHKG
ncbi:MAG: hypothetical protein KGZ39_05285 [Simkania sp.]|nr:hypothetical protein [Simkania sp.]